MGSVSRARHTAFGVLDHGGWVGEAVAAETFRGVFKAEVVVGGAEGGTGRVGHFGGGGVAAGEDAPRGVVCETALVGVAGESRFSGTAGGRGGDGGDGGGDEGGG